MRMTDSLNPATATREWFIVDAADVVLGRLGTEVAMRLRGKHKADFTPHVDSGDNIIVINAEKIKLTGFKEQNKMHYWHTGYPGGIKSISAGVELSGKHPQRIVQRAVQRMLPKTKLGRAQMRKLHVYVGSEHPHAAQKPIELKLKEAHK